MAKKRYIRLTTENVSWSGQVAVFIEHWAAGQDRVPMYVFEDPQTPGRRRTVPRVEAEFITAEEYFKESLHGKLFDG